MPPSFRLHLVAAFCVALLVLSPSVCGNEPQYTFEYLNTVALEARLGVLKETVCGSVMEVFSIGQSVKKRDLTVVRLTKDVGKGTNLGRPRFKYGKWMTLNFSWRKEREWRIG